MPHAICEINFMYIFSGLREATHPMQVVFIEGHVRFAESTLVHVCVCMSATFLICQCQGYPYESCVNVVKKNKTNLFLVKNITVLSAMDTVSNTNLS